MLKDQLCSNIRFTTYIIINPKFISLSYKHRSTININNQFPISEDPSSTKLFYISNYSVKGFDSIGLRYFYQKSLIELCTINDKTRQADTHTYDITVTQFIGLYTGLIVKEYPK